MFDEFLGFFFFIISIQSNSFFPISSQIREFVCIQAASQPSVKCESTLRVTGHCIQRMADDLSQLYQFFLENI